MTPSERQPRVPGDEYDRHGGSVGERIRETGVGAANATMWGGALRRALLWGVIGAVVGLVIGLIPWGSVSITIRLVSLGVGGFVGGATAGFVYGAGRERDLDFETRSETTYVEIDDGDPPERRAV